MPQNTLRCPNCGHPRQIGATSCPSCGIVYTKFAAKQSKLQEMEYQKQEQAENSRSKLAVYVASSLVIIAVLFFTLYDDKKTEDKELSVAKSGISHTNPYNPYNPYQSKKLISDGIKKRLQASTFTVRNSSLRYPNNRGGAIVITHNCQALTGWKISKTDTPSSSQTRVHNRLNRARDKVDTYQEILEEERQRFLADCTDCSEEALGRHIRREKRNFDSAVREYERAMEQMSSTVGKSTPLSATINKNHHSIRVDEQIKPLGLALLWIEDAAHCSPATIGDSSKLKIGDKIFMMTGDGRISDGTVNGFSTSRDGYHIINHTAHSKTVGHVAGTPLFNKNGEVLGINIPSLGKDSSAVRIEDVLDDFNLVL